MPRPENIPAPPRETGELFEKTEEIRELRARLEKLEAHLSQESSAAEKEKRVKQEIKSYLQEIQAVSSAVPASHPDEVKEIRALETDQQIGALISVVFQKGLSQAVSLARHLDNPAVLDEFHDALVDRYYDALASQGFLKL